MGGRCDAAAVRVTDQLGISCRHADPVITVRNPADLANWTLPVIELTMIAAAVFAFVHAWRRLRRDNDPTNIALWFASIVYLFVVEPPLYFPSWFGLEHSAGFLFAHNGFTVQFMYDRLPLYIVAVYPAMSQLAYEIVRSYGVFARRGALLGSVCVAFVCQVFYELFDQLGPQRKWWGWNLDNKLNHPLLASVPVNSVYIFASVSFGVLTYLVVRFVGRPTGDSRQLTHRALVGRTVAAGALTPLGMIVASLPTAPFGGKHFTGQAIVLTIEIAVVWLVGAGVLLTTWRDQRRETRRPEFSPYPVVVPAAYLAVLAGLWLASLPAFLDASHGITGGGTPTGSGWYVLLCFAAALACVVGLGTATRRSRHATIRARSAGRLTG